MTTGERDNAATTIHLGAEFFVNRTETRESIGRHFARMREFGLTMARIFVIWDDIERVPDDWTFEAYDWVYEAAGSEGIKIAATLCGEDPPGWTNLTPFYHHRSNLNDPERREHAARYIEKVVRRYKDHPAHAVWILMNEPDLLYNFEPSTLQRFGVWLAVRYGTVDAVNARWFHPLRDFVDVRLRPDQWDTSWCDYAAFIDWKEFNIDNLCAHLSWIHDQVRALDPIHPTHVNPKDLTGNFPVAAQDLWKEGRIVDVLGASIHPSWSFGDVARDEFGMLYAYCVDLVRGAAKGRPWWVTELQGGPTIFTGARPLNPTSGEITRWLWDAIGAGATGILFWLWHPRNRGREGGEWGLVGLDARPSSRLEAVGEVAATLRREAALFAAARPQRAQVAILYNRQTVLLGAIDGWTHLHLGAWQGRDREATLSLFGCYRALHRAHIPVEFIDIDELKSGGATPYEVIYMPYCYSIDDAAIEAVRQYVHAGGTVWADGLMAWKDADGNVRAQIPGGLTDVFGCEVEQIDPAWEPFSLTGDDGAGGELWTLSLKLTDAKAILRTPEGTPIVTRGQYGEGQAIYVGTALTLGYFKRPDPRVQEWIVAPALDKRVGMSIRITGDAERIAFRGMEHPTGQVAVLCNWGQTSVVTVRFDGRYQSVVDVGAHGTIQTTMDHDSTLAAITIEAGGVRILLAR